VTPTELLDILRQISKPGEDGKTDEWQQKLAATLTAHDQQVSGRMQQAAEKIAALPPDSIKNIDQVAPQVAAQIRRATGDLERWFDSMMARVSQRFATRMRLVTVAFSVILAFALHLDALALFKDIDTNAQLKAALLTSMDGMIKRGDAILSNTLADPYTVAAVRVRDETPELKKLAGIVPKFKTSDAGVEWIAANIQDPQQRAILTARYEALAQEELKASVMKLGVEAKAIRETLEASGIRLIPDASHSWLDVKHLTQMHLLGVLAAAALLSLGAPFWFQTLKTAASLRPIVATKAQEQQAGRA
jgi:hypothetical protein